MAPIKMKKKLKNTMKKPALLIYELYMNKTTSLKQKIYYKN